MPVKNIYKHFDYADALFEKTKENCVIIIETNGIIAAVNPAFTECFGYKPNDIIGKNCDILFTNEDRKELKPEKEVQRVLKTGQSNDNNYLVNNSGQKIWVSGESVLIENEKGNQIILKIVQNIHEQKLKEISINHLNYFNENILESIKAAVVVLDKEMNIVKSNTAFKSVFHKSEIPVSNINDFLKIADEDFRLFNMLENSIKTRTAFSNKEVVIKNPDRKKTFEVTCTPMKNSDESEVLLVMHDITIYKELQREREDIIGFITHELRNPLSNLMLSNDLMKDGVKENEISFLAEMLDRSENNIQRMNKMITSLYEATKVNSGYFPLDLSEFNFADMVKEAVDTIQRLHPSFNIRVEGNGNFIVNADRYRIIQVITNFLSNAIKYSNGHPDVKLSIEQDSESVTVSVEDNGLGIPEDHLPFVFERFFRVEKTRKIEGIGLGLYLCRQIIQSHKGHVGVKSEENKGSVFYFTIPLHAELVEQTV
ncbi:MAG: PAS domain-containing sensor histidine kinase [Ginsengibacter sp.]